MGLEWDADVGRLKRVVDQSPDFNSPNATAAMRAATKIATAKRNQEWKAEVEKIQQTSNLNHSAACRAFAKWPGIGASAETIRRVTK